MRKRDILQELRALKVRVDRQAQKMDDPQRDGSGDDARAPDGDDYNTLHAYVTAALGYILGEG